MKFKRELVKSIESGSKLVQYTNRGLSKVLNTLSNSQIKKLYRSKFPDISNKELSVLLKGRRAGTLNYDKLIRQLNSADQLKLTNSLDDLTLLTMRNTDNFITTTPSLLSQTFNSAGNIIGILQLIVVIRGELDISPMDVLAAVPNPISLFAMVGDHYINATIEEINRSFWEEASWNMVMNWEKWKTEPGIPNEQFIRFPNISKFCL